MELELKNKLDNLVGKDKNFEGINIKIESYKEVNYLIVIKTDARTFNFYPSEIEVKFLNKLEEYKEVKQFELPSIEKANEIQLATENTTVKEALLEALNKVRTDESYIGQASSICNIANSLINIQKVELQLFKMQKK